MSAKGAVTKLRGRPIHLPPWWLELANDCWRARKAEKWSMTDLANALTDVVDRNLDGVRKPWNRTTVEDFLVNRFPTYELMDAFCRLFPDKLIAPVFIADSESEARALANVSSAFHAAKNSNFEHRRAVLFDGLEHIEQQVEDQKDPVESSDEAGVEGREGVPGGRRPRGMGRGRTSSS